MPFSCCTVHPAEESLRRQCLLTWVKGRVQDLDVETPQVHGETKGRGFVGGLSHWVTHERVGSLRPSGVNDVALKRYKAQVPDVVRSEQEQVVVGQVEEGLWLNELDLGIGRAAPCRSRTAPPLHTAHRQNIGPVAQNDPECPTNVPGTFTWPLGHSLKSAPDALLTAIFTLVVHTGGGPRVIVYYLKP